MTFQQRIKSSTTTSINHIHSVGIINCDSLNISSNYSNTVSTITSRKRRNTLHILIHATIQLLSPPLTSPTAISSPNLVKQEHCSSPSSILSNDESSYVSFPEFETYDYNDVNDLSINNAMVQMEQFDEMFVNGVKVPSTHLD
ncbi:9229_t:CDS:1 [Scutellospora calospora]|uniref:9229_t:CDS:1 n=1 Tax=Scutellospora calospora TaxID=85575 RepID=A0ACA9K800_9GLOM|nr:9229_t:CDS:1 [Scutellospora calospora]